LKLYLVPEHNAQDKKKNRETLQLAEAIKSKRIVDLQNGRFGFENSHRLNISVIDYFQSVVDKMKSVGSPSYGNFKSALTHFKIFCKNRKPTFADINERFAEEWIEYLNSARRLNTHKDQKPTDNKDMPELSKNARAMYWMKFKSILTHAVKDKIIDSNPCDFIDGITGEQSERVFLTIEELRKMIDVECKNPMVKRAFLFSCLTGLRKSDILRLTWGELSQVDGFWRITFRQKKTGGLLYLDIVDEAREIIGERGDHKDLDLIFKGFNYSDKTNFVIREWANDAGVHKHLTFHSGRHTFSLLLLDQSTEIFTVQKLLGHKDVKTTMIYAHILDQKKREAVNKLPKIGFKK
jgi:integrase